MHAKRFEVGVVDVWLKFINILAWGGGETIAAVAASGVTHFRPTLTNFQTFPELRLACSFIIIQ